MAKANFRLATLMKLRKLERDQRRAGLVEAEEAQAVLEAQTAQLAAESRELTELRRQASSPDGLDVNQLVEAGRYQLLVESQAQTAADQSGLLEQATQQRRAAVVEANRNVETLRRLNERLEQQRKAAEERRDNQQLDEVAMATHQRKR